MKNYYVYILTTNNHRVMYTGITNHLIRRVDEHRNHLADGFTKKYNITKLVYFENTEDVSAAIAREKQLKGWRRSKKDKLIETINPNWEDLFDRIHN
jgi:putative endonuclease